MREVAQAPRGLSKKSRAKLEESYLFAPLRAGWIGDMEESAENHKWNRNISPSNKLSWGTCVQQYFNEQVHQPFKVSEETLQSVNAGSMLHRAFEYEFDRYLELAPPPNLPTFALKRWHMDIRPEVPIDDKESGIRGKIDRVIMKNGRPAPVDLKMTFKPAATWAEMKRKKQILQPKHLVQVMLYFYCITKGKYYDIQPQEVCVAYLNVPTVPLLSTKAYHEHWTTVTDERWHQTCAWVKAFTIGRKQALTNKTVVCKNPYCNVHGGR